MNNALSSKISLLLVCILIFYSSNSPASHHEDVLSIKKELELATKSKKLLLILLEASWCHDSKALNLYLKDDNVKEVLSDNYHFARLNVGFLENFKDRLKPVDYPIYFGTPTLLIIDPSSNIIVNRGTVGKWFKSSNEASNSLESYLLYYAEHSDFLAKNLERIVISQEVKDFESRQADILYEAYSIFGSMLEKVKSGQRVTGFQEALGKVGNYKMKLYKDLNKLYLEPNRNDLVIPKYNLELSQ